MCQQGIYLPAENPYKLLRVWRKRRRRAIWNIQNRGKTNK